MADRLFDMAVGARSCRWSASAPSPHVIDNCHVPNLCRPQVASAAPEAAAAAATSGGGPPSNNNSAVRQQAAPS